MIQTGQPKKQHFFLGSPVNPPTVKKMLPTNEKTSRKEEEKDQNKNDSLECGDKYL